MQLHGASDLDQRCLKTCNSKYGCTFPPNIFALTPKITPKPHFGGPFNAKPIIQIALRKSHVNGATKVKLYSYIGIGKYLGCEVSRVRVMLLMSVAYDFFLFTTRPTILLLVSLPLNSITNTKTVIQ